MFAAALFAFVFALLALALGLGFLVRGGDSVKACADHGAGGLDRAADDSRAGSGDGADDAGLQQQRTADDGQKGGRPREGFGQVKLPRRPFCAKEDGESMARILLPSSRGREAEPGTQTVEA